MSCRILVKIVLVALNFVIGLAGAAIGALGGLLRWGNESLWEKLFDWVKGICENAGMQCDPTNFTLIEGEVNIEPIVNNIGIVLFGIGLVIFLIGATGFFGTLFTVKWLLKIYTVVLGLISALIIAIAIFFLTAQSLMASIINPLLSNVVRDTYVDVWQLRKEFSLPAFLINAAMVELKCCGFESWKDYARSEKWNKTYGSAFFHKSTFENQIELVENHPRSGQEKPLRIGISSTFVAQVPMACCKLVNYQGLSDMFNMTLLDKTCPINPQTNNSYIDTQCFAALRSWIMSEFIWAIAIVGGIWLTITAIVALTSCYVSMKTADVKPEN